MASKSVGLSSHCVLNSFTYFKHSSAASGDQANFLGFFGATGSLVGVLLTVVVWTPARRRRRRNRRRRGLIYIWDVRRHITFFHIILITLMLICDSFCLTSSEIFARSIRMRPHFVFVIENFAREIRHLTSFDAIRDGPSPRVTLP